MQKTKSSARAAALTSFSALVLAGLMLTVPVRGPGTKAAQWFEAAHCFKRLARRATISTTQGTVAVLLRCVSAFVPSRKQTSKMVWGQPASGAWATAVEEEEQQNGE